MTSVRLYPVLGKYSWECSVRLPSQPILLVRVVHSSNSLNLLILSLVCCVVFGDGLATGSCELGLGLGFFVSCLDSKAGGFDECRTYGSIGFIFLRFNCFIVWFIGSNEC